ncbi:16S rRNA C967 or C1407 C5-methylase, RsmB/RsmF family [Chitinophaga terrae (ex Kim and Jung 2007)]|uniref:16S rRNA C967 or C1407 C5-methylase, RsmB/RsmF family n=1 Tax=Chitinophaga terrae (ex Kim and Jung 2007) TaxID=408074 RepID=A0A1H4BZP0_9BACT|nr:RNA methyltransferase [Chitinophaga terrae (ex Kim and Jung 2007)]SEA53661.1 16S rRNA C967 or C1407 C5-methylase, RsmB/RsmF family [Chitinophaga terrae (ex Kim and Jung 2007)]
MSSHLPAALLESLEGIPGYNRATFEQVHEAAEKVTSLRLNPNKLRSANGIDKVLQSLSATGVSKVPWTSQGYYLPQRPSFTLDPYFHAGAYYVQEASSMFLEYAVKQTTDPGAGLKVLDLCAAPGGKSTLLQSLLPDNSLLVSNEVIKSRAALLADNLTKWGAANVVVSNNDPKDFAALQGYFDLVVVDAPCSGSGLFRRDPELISEWSLDHVALCSQRQQRILADILPALKASGVLIYSTCSFSAAEDEAILDWLADHFELENIPLPIPEEWNIIITETSKRNLSGYRFYPDRLKGEGLFLACLRKKGGEKEFREPKQKNKTGTLTAKQLDLLSPWVNKPAGYEFFLHQDEVLGLAPAVAAALPALQQQLYIRKAGVKLGQLGAKELIPDHQLAMSTLAAEQVPVVELSKQAALQYLKKEDPGISLPVKGWGLVAYEGMQLGWAKFLPNRINNYYPKELRILKDIQGL